MAACIPRALHVEEGVRACVRARTSRVQPRWFSMMTKDNDLEPERPVRPKDEEIERIDPLTGRP